MNIRLELLLLHSKALHAAWAAAWNHPQGMGTASQGIEGFRGVAWREKLSGENLKGRSGIMVPDFNYNLSLANLDGQESK